MTEPFEPLLEERIEISAPTSVVWELVRDVRRMAEWSPQVDSTRLRDDEDQVALGGRFTNRNVHGELRWTTHATVVRWEDQHEIAFRIEENWVVWSFRLEPSAHGTLLIQRRETPEGISDFSLELTDTYLGGQRAFTQVMRDGMRRTLEAIKSAAERTS